MRRRQLGSLLILTAGFGVGCSNKLETGYQPRPLGATSSERRGYYASPFTPEAAAAAKSTDADEVRNMRRPVGGPAGVP